MGNNSISEPIPSSYADQAIAILQGTQDGDMLDPSDLRLLQEVVNSRGASLSEQGVLYWNDLHAKVASGQYQKRWFCGVEHLKQDTQGYVSWKDVRIEHYSYQIHDHDEMVDSARRLGAICLALEAEGIKVNSTNVMAKFNELDFGQGIEAPRFLVMWKVTKEEAKVIVVPMTATDLKLAKDEQHDLLDRQATLWGLQASSIRTYAVRTAEELAIAQECLIRDYEWGRHQFWPNYSNSDIKDAMLKTLSSDIDSASLMTRQQMESILIGPHLAEVTKQSIETLAQDSLPFQRPQERMQG